MNCIFPIMKFSRTRFSSSIAYFWSRPDIFHSKGTQWQSWRGWEGRGIWGDTFWCWRVHPRWQENGFFSKSTWGTSYTLWWRHAFQTTSCHLALLAGLSRGTDASLAGQSSTNTSPRSFSSGGHTHYHTAILFNAYVFSFGSSSGSSCGGFPARTGPTYSLRSLYAFSP